MYSFAFDQSLKVTGWAYFEDDILKDCGQFEVDPTLDIDDRLAQFQEEVGKIANTAAKDTQIFFEDIQMQMGNVKTYQRLAYTQAAMLLFCNVNDYKYNILSPSHWRKVIGGKWGRKREEQKQHAINFVKEKYNIEVGSDVADAICIGYAGLQEQKQEQEGF